VTTPDGDTTIKVSDANYLPLLAAYWQSYKDLGRAPNNAVFLPGGDSSGEGQNLAESREGSFYAGTRNTYKFAFDPRAGTWRFAVGGGYTMVCGSVLDTQTQTPVSGLLYQDSDENNYGAPLPPGSYFTITTSAEHEVCVYPAIGGPENDSWSGLSVAGNDVYSSNVTGQRTAQPGLAAREDLVDLKTEYVDLSSKLTQYTKQYTTCDELMGKSCLKSLAQHSAKIFSLFNNFMTTHRFPSQFRAEVDALGKTARKINMLYEAVSSGNDVTGNMSSIPQSVKDFARGYKKLVKGLSSA
jgi:hypothetical protein